MRVRPYTPVPGTLFRYPFDLRQQVGKLIVSELAVFPPDPDAGTVLYDYFARHPIRGPDHHFTELKSSGFLWVHKDRALSDAKVNHLYRAVRQYHSRTTHRLL
jgi:hypothetical protein